MKMKTKKIAAVIMALTLSLSFAVNAFATTISENGGSGATSVLLSTVDENGDPAPTKLDVTVPTSLPVTMDENGTVTTATDCELTNNSYGPVMVTSVTIEAKSGWKLCEFGDPSSLANEKVGANKIGFSITLGEGDANETDDSSDSKQTLVSAADEDHGMSGVGDSDNNTLTVSYDAIATAVAETVTEAEVAEIVFIVAFDEAEA